MRIFPTDSVKITFSNTEDQQDETLTFAIDSKGTKVLHNKTQIEEIATHLQSGEVNLVNILFKENEINLNNEGLVAGHFSRLRFIGFSSENLTSWVINESKLFIFWKLSITVHNKKKNKRILNRRFIRQI